MLGGGTSGSSGSPKRLSFVLPMISATRISDSMSIRPEICYEHAYENKAFDLGTERNQLVFSVDLIVRF